MDQSINTVNAYYIHQLLLAVIFLHWKYNTFATTLYDIGSTRRKEKEWCI